MLAVLAEFRDSIVVAGPQRATPFHDIDQHVSMAGPAALTKLPEKGKIFRFIISVLLGKEWIALNCTATIIAPHHELPAPHLTFT
jgi:hypothetical protein